jgi:type IV pili sensor histidine kinase/response regulator
MLLLSLTVGGCALSSLAVAIPATTEGSSSASDQIILITPNWKPSVAPVEPPKPVQLAEKPAQPAVAAPVAAPVTATVAQKTLPTPSAAPVPVVLPATVAAPAPVISKPVVIKKPAEPERIVAPLPVWQATSGSTLHKTVAEWAAKEQYTVLWEAGDLDYPIVSPLSFRGNFEEAVTQIFGLYEKAERHFYVQGWRSQRLIKITERNQVDAKQVGKSL